MTNKEKTSLVQDISKKIIKETQLNGDYEFDTDFTIKDLVEQTAELGIQKGKDLTTQDILEALNNKIGEFEDVLKTIPENSNKDNRLFRERIEGKKDSLWSFRKELTASHSQKTDGASNGSIGVNSTSRSGTREAGASKGQEKPSNTLAPEDNSSEKPYGCGHKPKPIILDDNELSTSVWLDWVETTGFRGNSSECFDCYLKRTDKKEGESPEGQR